MITILPRANTAIFITAIIWPRICEPVEARTPSTVPKILARYVIDESLTGGAKDKALVEGIVCASSSGERITSTKQKIKYGIICSKPMKSLGQMVLLIFIF